MKLRECSLFLLPIVFVVMLIRIRQLEGQISQAGEFVCPPPLPLASSLFDKQQPCPILTHAPTTPRSNAPTSTAAAIVSSSVSSPFHRLEIKRPLDVCVSTCRQGGVGSQVSVLAFWVNASLELGFKLHLQNKFEDYDNPRATDTYMKAIFPYADYSLKRCDVYVGDNYQVCYKDVEYLSSMGFQLHDSQLYTMYAQYYAVELRDVAWKAHAELLKAFPEVDFIGVHVRDHADDGRNNRVYDNDYETMKVHLEKVCKKPPTYLVMGSPRSTKSFIDKNPTGRTMVNLSDWISSRFPGFTWLQYMFVSMDVMSRVRIRMIMRWSNNYLMHMAFHRVNGNVMDLVVGDIFTMKVYDYYYRELATVRQVPELQSILDSQVWNPYTSPYIPTSAKAQQGVRECMGMKLFGPAQALPTVEAGNACQAFLNEYKS